MRLFLILMVMLAALAAGCDNGVPTVPAIVVPITAVENATALEAAVAEALTGTAMNGVAMTETQFARDGITLTPTASATATRTPPAPSATLPLTPTATYTPSVTPTETFAPFPTSVLATEAPSQSGAQAAARLRVVNAWIQFGPRASSQVDVYVNDVRVTHALDVRQTTNYQRVSAGAVRISLYPIDIDPAAQLSKPPLVSQTVNVSAGSSVSVVIANMGDGLTLIPVVEDASPLPSGMSRLTLLQANPGMLPVNILLPEAKRTLAQNLEVADIVGPIELPRADYRLELYDSANPDLFISDVSGINLTGQVNHLLVFVPAPPETLDLTETLLFTGSTRPVETDANTRFINAATEVGSLSLGWDGQSQITNLGVGEMSVAVPVSTRGTQALITNPQGNRVTDVQLGPWLGDLNDKIVLLLNAPESSLEPLTAISFSQNAPTSAIRANLRLIHALPDTVPLSLQTRIYRTETRTNDLGVAEVVRTDTPWEVVTANVPFGLASDYAGRAPDLYDVRVVLTGTETVIAQISLFQFLVGNAYDFVVAPGPEPGSANLLLVQPEVQVGVNGEDVTGPVLDEIVHATLTAMVTAAADTPTPVRTATPTISPVPTNTVYPSSTPSVHDPELLIDPAPPNTASGTFTLVGVNFAPNERYVISMDGGPDLLSGRVSPDGSLIAVVPLAPETTPGPHVVSVCVDCQRNGEQQARFVVVVVADPNTTLTPTAVP